MCSGALAMLQASQQQMALLRLRRRLPHDKASVHLLRQSRAEEQAKDRGPVQPQP